MDIGFTRPAWLERRKMKASEREQLPQRAGGRPDHPHLHRRVEPQGRAADRAGRLRSRGRPRLRAPAHQARAVRPGRPPPWSPRRSRAGGAGRAPPPRRLRSIWGWLRTVRPWWGHHDHLHVRLKCPADSTGCESQPPLAAGRRLRRDRLVGGGGGPAGPGAPRAAATARRAAAPAASASRLPAACQALLDGRLEPALPRRSGRAERATVQPVDNPADPVRRSLGLSPGKAGNEGRHGMSARLFAIALLISPALPLARAASPR